MKSIICFQLKFAFSLDNLSIMAWFLSTFFFGVGDTFPCAVADDDDTGDSVSSDAVAVAVAVSSGRFPVVVTAASEDAVLSTASSVGSLCCCCCCCSASSSASLGLRICQISLVHRITY